MGLPGHDNAAVLEHGERGSALLVDGHVVDDHRLAELQAIRTEALRKHIQRRVEAAPGGPGDQETAGGKGHDRGAELLVLGLGIDADLSADRATAGVIHLGEDTAAGAVHAGPCNDVAAVVQHGDDGLLLVAFGGGVHQHFIADQGAVRRDALGEDAARIGSVDAGPGDNEGAVREGDHLRVELVEGLAGVDLHRADLSARAQQHRLDAVAGGILAVRSPHHHGLALGHGHIGEGTIEMVAARKLDFSPGLAIRAEPAGEEVHAGIAAVIGDAGPGDGEAALVMSRDNRRELVVRGGVVDLELLTDLLAGGVVALAVDAEAVVGLVLALGGPHDHITAIREGRDDRAFLLAGGEGVDLVGHTDRLRRESLRDDQGHLGRIIHGADLQGQRGAGCAGVLATGLRAAIILHLEAQGDMAVEVLRRLEHQLAVGDLLCGDGDVLARELLAAQVQRTLAWQ